VVEEPVTRDGREMVATGSRVEGRIERIGLASTGRPFMELSLTALAFGPRTLPIRTGSYTAVAPLAEHGQNFGAIIIGSAAGGAVGGAVGGGKGAISGAAIGAAGGTIARDDTPTDYRFGGRLPFRLAEAVHESTP
jgi:uncharacterized membrane protein